MGETLSGSGRFPESGLSEQDVTAAPPPAGPTLGSSAGLVGERAVSVSSGRHHNAPRTRWPNQQNSLSSEFEDLGAGRGAFLGGLSAGLTDGRLPCFHTTFPRCLFVSKFPPSVGTPSILD